MLVMRKMPFVEGMAINLMANACELVNETYLVFISLICALVESVLFLVVYLQVELAHGGRASSSVDRHSSYSSGGLSRRSDYRGLFILLFNLVMPSNTLYVFMKSS